MNNNKSFKFTSDESKKWRVLRNVFIYIIYNDYII